MKNAILLIVGITIGVLVAAVNPFSAKNSEAAGCGCGCSVSQPPQQVDEGEQVTLAAAVRCRRCGVNCRCGAICRCPR